MFELKPYEYIDVTRYTVEKRRKMFPKVEGYFMTCAFCILFRYSSGRYDTFESLTDNRRTWRQILKDFKEVHVGINKLGRM